uniref:Antifreeze protein a n=1 Tax=Stephos longipes TaxID=201679 RepID=B8Y5Y6_9MAXI|nr:antifreeze protein a [Stephos longipes]
MSFSIIQLLATAMVLGVTMADGPSRVNLLKAGKFALLTKTGVTTTGITKVKGDMGTSPIARAALTGFTLVADSTNEFSESPFVTGNVYASNDAVPTPQLLTDAVLDMQAAYTDAAGRPDPDHLNFGAGSIEGETLLPGLYKWDAGVSFTDGVTFEGSSTDIWILQIGAGLNVGSGAKVKLAGGAKVKNIFWQIVGPAVLGTGSHVQGVFLCKTNMVFQTGSSLKGAVLAQTAVTLDSARITKRSFCDITVGCETS